MCETGTFKPDAEPRGYGNPLKCIDVAWAMANFLAGGNAGEGAFADFTSIKCCNKFTMYDLRGIEVDENGNSKPVTTTAANHIGAIGDLSVCCEGGKTRCVVDRGTICENYADFTPGKSPEGMFGNDTTCGEVNFVVTAMGCGISEMREQIEWRISDICSAKGPSEGLDQAGQAKMTLKLVSFD